MAGLVKNFQKWLKDIKATKDSQSVNNPTIDQSEQTEPIPSTSKNDDSNSTKFKPFKISDFNSVSKVKVFENKTLSIYVEKTIHRRLKRFKFLDNLFQIKIEVNKSSSAPLLKDLLEIFQEVFEFVVNHIKTFFNENDHNVAYLTLYQEPMVNGLNTGK